MTDDMKSTTVPEGYDEADPCCASVQWHCAGVACCGCEVNQCVKGVVFEVGSIKDAMEARMKELMEESK